VDVVPPETRIVDRSLTHRYWLVLTGMALSAICGRLEGQAVCSAPHSSPVLSRGGTIQTLAPGQGYVQVSALHQSSSQFFNPDGDRVPFLGGAQIITNSGYFTTSVGVLRGIDTWFQLPIHNVQNNDATGESQRTGLGDLRLSARVSPEVFGAVGIPLSVRAGIKIPGSEFPVDARIIPLGEGQRDWEVSVESGIGFPVKRGDIFEEDIASVYVLGWIGYRWREENGETGFKPGNEWFAHGAVGGHWGKFNTDLAVDILAGQPPEQLGLVLPNASRRLVTINPTVGWKIGRGTLEATAQIPVAGRNLPSGAAASLGYRWTWGGW